MRSGERSTRTEPARLGGGAVLALIALLASLPASPEQVRRDRPESLHAALLAAPALGDVAGVVREIARLAAIVEREGQAASAPAPVAAAVEFPASPVRARTPGLAAWLLNLPPPVC